MELKGKKINFLGDSITEGHGTSAPENIFLNRLSRATGATANNYGISGSRIARQLHPDNPDDRHERWFVTRVPEMDPDADLNVVFGGTNDWGHGDAPLGTFADRTDDTFYGAMHNLCLALLEKYPTAVTVFLTPLYRTNEQKHLSDRGLRQVGSLDDYRRAIKEVAGYYGLPVFEWEKVTGMNPEVVHLAQRYMPDGLHPSDAGHEIMAARLQGFLESL